MRTHERPLKPRYSIRLMALLAVVALFAAACSSDSSDTTAATTPPSGETVTPPSGETVTLKMAVDTPPGDQLSNMLVYLTEEVDGDDACPVEIDPFYGGSFGDAVAIIEALRVGELDGASVGSDITELDPIFGILEFPFLFSDRDQVTEFLDGPLGREMSDSLEDTQGLRVLVYGENGFRQMTNNVRPIVVPADLDGLKIRLPGVQARVVAFETFGAAPTTMDFGEIYIGLDQGIIDGQENPLAIIENFSFYEVQKYLSLSSHVYTPASLVLNVESWSALSPEAQECIEAAGVRAAERSRADGAAADAAFVATLTDAGMEVNVIDTDAFKEASIPIWAAFEEQVGPDFVKRALDALGISG